MAISMGRKVEYYSLNECAWKCMWMKNFLLNEFKNKS